MQSVKYDFGNTGLFRYGSYSNLPQINQLCFHNGFADFYQTRRDRNQGSKYCKVDNLSVFASFLDPYPIKISCYSTGHGREKKDRAALHIQYKCPVTPQHREVRRKIEQLITSNTNFLLLHRTWKREER